MSVKIELESFSIIEKILAKIAAENQKEPKQKGKKEKRKCDV